MAERVEFGVMENHGEAGPDVRLVTKIPHKCTPRQMQRISKFYLYIHRLNNGSVGLPMTHQTMTNDLDWSYIQQRRATTL